MADLDLARRAVACSGWRWMRGMAWVHDFAGGHALGDRSGLVLTDWDAVDSGGRVFRLHDRLLPDLTDPATLGCLLALVRERWDDHTISPMYRTSLDWWVRCGHGGVSGSTYAAALIAALKAAP